MSTLSVPLPAFLEEYIQNEVKSGNYSNKAEVVRNALIRMKEEQAINDILEAQQEVRSGKVLRGDLRELAKKFK